MDDGTERPIYFASRTMNKAEKNYPQLQKEALSIIFAVRKFHVYLYGRHFTLITDHKPLLTLLAADRAVPVLAAARLQRWALLLSTYNYTIQYKPGKNIQNADGFSRNPLPEVEEQSANEVMYFSPLSCIPLDAGQIAQESTKEMKIIKAIDFTLKGWPDIIQDQELDPYFVRRHELNVEEGCLLWGRRVIIPAKLRQQVLELLHEQHPGIVHMKSLARSYVWWENMDMDIEEFVKKCHICQGTRNGKPQEEVTPWTWTTRVFERIHIDFAMKYDYNFLIVVDAYSKVVGSDPNEKYNSRKHN